LTANGNTGGFTLSGTDASKFGIVNGKLVFLQAQNYEGTQKIFSVTVEARDAAGNVATKVVTVNLTNVNEAPTAIALSANTVAENAAGAVIGALTTTDPDNNDTFTYMVSDARFEVVNGQLKLKAGVPLDFEKEPVVNLEVTATDLGGLTTKQAFTINVGNLNDNAPVIDMNASYDVAENQVVVAALSAVDADNLDGYTYSVVGGADKALFTVNNSGQLVFKNAPDFEGGKTSFEVEVKVFDGFYSTTKTITVNLTDANDAPTAIALDVATVEENADGAVIGTLSTTDQDAGDSFAYSVNDNRFEVVDGQLKLKAGEWINYEVEKTVTVEVTSTDREGASTQKSFTIDVTDVNDANPELTLAQTTFTLSEGQNNVELVTLTATDVDTPSEALTYEITGGADAGKFKIEDGKLVYVGGDLDYDLDGQQKSFEVKIKAFDNNRNESAEQIITVNLQDLNDTAPEITSGSTGVLLENQNNYVVATLTSVDKDTTGQTTTYEITGGADAGLFEINSNNELVYTGGALDYEYVNQKKSFVVTVTASDGVNTSSKEITVNLKDVNDNAPVIDMNASYEAAENQLVVTTLIAKDQDTAEAGVKIFHVSGGTDAALFTVNADGQLVFRQAPDYEGGKTSFEVEVQLTDGHYIVKKTLTVVLTNVNDAPTAITLVGNTVDENAAGVVIGNLSTADQDAGETFTYSVSDERFEVVNGQIKLKAGISLDFEEDESIELTVTSTDRGGLSTSKTFTIEVQDKNDAPTAIALDGATVDENAAGAVIGTLSTTDQDAGETFTYTVDDERFEVVNGQLKLKAGVSLDFEDADAIEVTVTSKDSNNATTTQDFTIEVQDKNDAPTDVTLSANEVDENAAGAVIGTLSTTDQDAEDSFTYTVNDQRFEVVNGQLKLKEGVSLDFEEEQTVSLIVTSKDAGGLTTQQNFTVNVANLNDNAPVITTVEVNLDENTDGRTTPVFIADLQATDADGELNQISFKDKVGTLFKVENGKLYYVGAPLDFEKAVQKEFSVEVEVTDGSYTTPKTITVKLQDVNDNAPVIDMDASYDVAENQVVVAKLSAKDADSVGEKIFSVIGGADRDLFTVDANGQLVFKQAPDFESDKASYTVEVQVTDGIYSATKTITVNLKDANDAPTAIALSANEVDENAAGAGIGKLTTTDEDANETFTYTVDDVRFEVVDGELRLKDGISLDFETEPTVQVTVTSKDAGGLTKEESFTIDVKDVNEAPTAVIISTNKVAENAAGAVIGTLSTDDQDAEDSVTYTVDDVRFEVVNGQLKLKDGISLDFEDESAIDVEVTSEDAAGLTKTQSLRISVTDVNEAPTAVILGNRITQTAENGAAVMVADLTVIDDAVGTETLSLVGADAASFEIRGNQLWFRGGANFEAKTSYSVAVKATDGELAEEVTSETFTLNVTDVNEAPSKVAISGGSVLENSADGTLVGSLSALDPDAGDSFTYSLVNNADGRFAVTADGKILVADSLKLDFEQAASHQVVVRVTDKNGTGLSHDEVLTLSVGDVQKEGVSGSQGADRIVGGAGNDWFFGGAGSDAIYGGVGKDTIDGSSGNDQIYGGAGKDTLKGGSGKDAFFFGNKETGSTKGTADYISDFNGKAGDRINLRDIDANTTKKGNQNFSWIGKNDFTKAGQARFEKANGSTYVYLNTDNDKAAEAVIKLKGMLDLQKSWFVL
jgi:VCBS repeat-containing protein